MSGSWRRSSGRGSRRTVDGSGFQRRRRRGRIVELPPLRLLRLHRAPGRPPGGGARPTARAGRAGRRGAGATGRPPRATAPGFFAGRFRGAGQGPLRRPPGPSLRRAVLPDLRSDGGSVSSDEATLSRHHRGDRRVRGGGGARCPGPGGRHHAAARRGHGRRAHRLSRGTPEATAPDGLPPHARDLLPRGSLPGHRPLHARAARAGWDGPAGGTPHARTGRLEVPHVRLRGWTVLRDHDPVGRRGHRLPHHRHRGHRGVRHRAAAAAASHAGDGTPRMAAALAPRTARARAGRATPRHRTERRPAGARRDARLR